jgi:hypothetical protein
MHKSKLFRQANQYFSQAISIKVCHNQYYWHFSVRKISTIISTAVLHRTSVIYAPTYLDNNMS